MQTDDISAVETSPAPAGEDRQEASMDAAIDAAFGKRGFRQENPDPSDGGAYPAAKEGNGKTSAGGDGDGSAAGGAGPSPTVQTPPAAGGADSGVRGPGSEREGGLTPGQIAERRAYNRQQASLRIARKRERERLRSEEMQRIQRKVEYYGSGGEGNDPTMAKVADDQMRDLQLQFAQERRQEWETDARELFTPEDAEQFIEDSRTYSQWVNENEPELRKYIDKPYGKYLLKGWMDKVAKVPEMADKWESLNPFQKYQMLERQYNELAKFGEDYAAGKVSIGQQQQQQQQQQQPDSGAPDASVQGGVQNASVPGSGRSTNYEPNPDDIGGLIDKAFERRKRQLRR